MDNTLLSSIRNQFPVYGKLEWIGLRPSRQQALDSVQQVYADADTGLEGDHYKGKSGKRHITLIQHEHLAVLEALINQKIKPEMLRRNLIVSNINLLALKSQYFQIGEAILLATGNCHPCSRMEKILGKGGYNAMRGHGGITAKVIKSGTLKLGDQIKVLNDFENQGHL